MPIYEYRCTACSERFSRQESIEDHGRQIRPAPPCPRCGADTVEPVYSPFFAKTVRKS